MLRFEHRETLRFVSLTERFPLWFYINGKETFSPFFIFINGVAIRLLKAFENLGLYLEPAWNFEQHRFRIVYSSHLLSIALKRLWSRSPEFLRDYRRDPRLVYRVRVRNSCLSFIINATVVNLIAFLPYLKRLDVSKRTQRRMYLHRVRCPIHESLNTGSPSCFVNLVPTRSFAPL